MKTIAKQLQNGEWIRHPQTPQRIGIAALLLLTMLWGSTFVILKDTLTSLPAGLLMGLRFSLSALVLLPLLPWSLAALRVSYGSQVAYSKTLGQLAIAGGELGLLLFAGYGSQTLGLLYTTVHRSAFVTSLNVVFVPLVLGLLGRRIRRRVWAAALVAIAGVGLLSYDGTPLNLGDLWTLGTAIAYALYIIRIDHYVMRFPALALSIAQLLVMALLSLLWMVTQQGVWLGEAIASGAWLRLPWGALLFLALACTALTTLLQLWGQRQVPPAPASVLFTLEPVWASLFALVLLGERLSFQGLLGAGAICAASLLTISPAPALHGSVAEGEERGR